MLIPFNYRILVKPVDLSETDPVWAAAKRAGLEITRTEKAREEGGVDRGYVVAIGSHLDDNIKNEIHVGDEIFFARYAGKKIEDPYTKEKFVAINDEDAVLKIVKETE